MSEVIEYIEGWILKAQNAVNALRSLESAEPNGHHPDGAAVAEKPRREYHRRAATDPAGSGKKTCNKCGKVKPLAEFTKAKKSADGRTGTCRVCLAEYARGLYRLKHNRGEGREGPKGIPLPWKCETCNGRFSTKNALDEHVEDRHP